MSSEADYETLTRQAEAVLEESWDRPVRLLSVDRLTESRHRNLVLRARMADAHQGADTVIIKQAWLPGYAADDPSSRAAVGLFRDWAGLQFLAGVDDGRLGTPALHGGDREAGFFVMEDLGRSDLDAVLTCGHNQAAREALTDLAVALGRMHAMTTGREQEYQQIRNALGPQGQNARRRLADHVRTYATEFEVRCHALDVDVAAGLSADLEHVAQVMTDPGPFLAFTHADACPDNVAISQGRLRLFDYEFSGYRHALLDGVYGRFRFPTCWCVRDIPGLVLDEMEQSYRQELVAGCGVAADDDIYHRAVADGCAYWMLENLAHMLDRAIRYEQPRGTATNRQRLLTRLRAFCDSADRARHLPALNATLHRLADRLEQRWQTQMPLFDAFHSSQPVPKADVELFVAACQRRDFATLRRLLEQHPDLANAKHDDRDQSPMLYRAASAGDEMLLEVLLAAGANPHVTTRTGWTVLGAACSDGTPGMVDLLIDYGCDINNADTWGMLPIHAVIEARRPEMLQHLLSRGARPDLKVAFDLQQFDLARQLVAQDPTVATTTFGSGLTLLHDAAQRGTTHLQAMELLLEAGASVHRTTNWGATPLHLAAFHGHTDSCRLLLQHSADATQRDKLGLTPADLAAGKGHVGCSQVLGGQTPLEADTAAMDAFYSGLYADQREHPLDESADE